VAAPKIKVKAGGKIAVEPEDPGAEVREERPKRGKRKRNELKAAHEVLHTRSLALKHVLQLMRRCFQCLAVLGEQVILWPSHLRQHVHADRGHSDHGSVSKRILAAQLPLGEEDDVEDADFAEEDAAEDDYFRLGEQDEQFRDYASLALKEDHANRCARSPTLEALHACCSNIAGFAAKASSACPSSSNSADQTVLPAQAAVGVPGRPHLPGDVLATVQAGIRLPHRHCGAGELPRNALQKQY